MSRDDDFIDKAAEARGSLDKLLKNEAWGKSFMLKKQKNKLAELLVTFDEALENIRSGATMSEPGVHQYDELAHDESLVYITLYQVSGKDLMRWQVAMHAIESCSFGRPIYEDESAARQIIKANGEGDSDGYVEVIVPSSSIIRSAPGREMVDKLGQAVINIRPGVLVSDRIRAFVHHNDVKYTYKAGKLLIDTSSADQNS
ncbi:MAG: type IVB secretion system protein IcmQ [Pseudomonadota bacterium]|nr:type IVB secretion system protein IcmQ [Pseudomonadota bacterium]MEC8978221.1 type IVB secretion system protein IcmQ [Pseudomonadota bacterium]